VSDRFRLDGGAMFGSVPKTLWSRSIPADEKNRIQLCCRLLVLRGNGIFALVDCGMGSKWDDKGKEIFAIEPLISLDDKFPKLTHLVLTHLHFDHCAGLSRKSSTGELELVFPHATHIVSEENLRRAEKPGLRERASYLSENIQPLLKSTLRQTVDGEELFTDITAHQVHGHTRGLQWLLIRDKDETIAYPSDLIPTIHHVSLPYVMGYDMCAETAMNEKEKFLEQAVKENWLVVFEHDAETPAARIRKENGRFSGVADESIPTFDCGS